MVVSIAIAAAIAAVCCAFGMRLLRPAENLAFHSFLERAVFGAAVGMGAAAYLVLALGLAHWLYPWAIAALFVVLAALAWREAVQLVVAVVRGLRALFTGPASVGGAVIGIFLVLMLGLAILGALAPSSQNDWDGLSYHLAVPKIYLQNHGTDFLGWITHSNFPFTLEMLYAVGLALDGQAAAKLMHTLCAVLVVLAMLAFGAAHWERRHGALAAVVFMSAPVVAWEVTSGLNDLAAALFTLLALYAFINWWSGRGARWLQVAAVICGFALGVKMNALVLLGFLAVAALYHHRVSQRDGIAAGARAAGAFLLIAAAVASPWYIKSYLWTGNPVYPFFYEWFGGKYWTAEAARLYRVEQLGFGMGRGALAALLAPWNLTMYGWRFSNFPGHPLLYISVGPLLLALLPGLIALGRLDRRVKFLLAYSLIASCAWFALSQHIRYAIPLLPGLALCAGFAGGELLRKGKKELRAVVVAAIVVSCLVSLAVLGVLVSNAIPLVTGQETQAAYLTRSLDGLYEMAQVVNGLPTRSKIIMYGETRGFYFNTPYMWGNHHHNMIPYDSLGGPDELIAAYRRLGVTHVLMTAQFRAAARLRRDQLGGLLAALMDSGRLVPVAQRGYLILYRITEPGA